MIALSTHLLYWHRNRITSVPRIHPGYIHWPKNAVFYFLLLWSKQHELHFCPDSSLHSPFEALFTAITSLFLRIPFLNPQKMVEAFTLLPVIPSQMLNPVLLPSFLRRQWNGVWSWRRGTLRTKDNILFAQLPPNALTFCSLKPDYTSLFKSEPPMLYRYLPSNGSPATLPKINICSWISFSWTHPEL